MTAVELAGIVEGLDEAEYHRHPALSSSGAKKLLPPSCPALFRHERDNGQAPRRTFDVGHAAHAQLLGVGGEVVVIDADGYTTKAAREQRDAARDAGMTPLLRSEQTAVDGMVSAVRAHPLAGPLFVDGRPEVSVFWEDWAHGVSRRARIDWLRIEDGVAHVIDLKTTTSAQPAAFNKSVAAYGYDVQVCWYTDAVREMGLAEEVRFTFVAVEKTAPYLVSTFQLSEDWLRIGRAKVEQALSIYAECSARNEWPGYSDAVTYLSPPGWLAREYEDVLR